MKDLSLLVWLSQLGLSVALPPVGFILLAVWLRDRWGWGNWVLWVGIILGIYCAITGCVASMKSLKQLTANKKDEAHPVSFNEHN